jgi:hypothetical protein
MMACQDEGEFTRLQREDIDSVVYGLSRFDLTTEDVNSLIDN